MNLPLHLLAPVLILSPWMQAAAIDAKDFKVVGDVHFGDLSRLADEAVGQGFRLSSERDVDGNGKLEGSVSRTYDKINPKQGRWYSLRIRGLAQEGFAVNKNNLYLKVVFSGKQAGDDLDFIKKEIYGQVERERKDLKDEGTNRNLGSATWRQYELAFRTPFPEVDRIVATVAFANGKGKGARSGFWINEFEMVSISAPAGYVAPGKPKVVQPSDLKSLVQLGGRWYYDPRGGSRKAPAQFDHTNSDRILYLTDRLEAPFTDNLDSWLKPGWLDRKGDMMTKVVYVPDSVVITVTDEHLVMKSKNLPNHPTANFPDYSRKIDGNPNYVAEQNLTFYLPLVPKRNTRAIAMDKRNTNRALPGGPIGVAANGVIFFNPFDHIAEADAVWRLDRCCGHPSPNSQYHYHKYPVCVKSPWADDGEGHSPVIGFAFDGYPVYGPYEAKGVLAKNSKENPLNDFNVHQDDKRGWHYHVTPGQFPHIMGGYWGVMEEKNRRARGPRPGGPGGRPGGRPGRGPGRRPGGDRPPPPR
ncbi:MAG: YHYH protein [Opitutales bacterium]